MENNSGKKKANAFALHHCIGCFRIGAANFQRFFFNLLSLFSGKFLNNSFQGSFKNKDAISNVRINGVAHKESSFHVGSTYMMDVAGSGINAAASNPDPLMLGLEDYFAACDQASAKFPKKFPPIPEKQRQRMRQITAEFLLHAGTPTAGNTPC